MIYECEEQWMRSMDINCDLGESFGVYRLGDDNELLLHITSANIACGFHAGDPSVMRETVRQCLLHDVRIGAHPGLPDLQGFGRRMMNISPQEAYDWTVYQIGALQGFITVEGGRLQHVKPHGALYQMASAHQDIAVAIAEAVYRINPELIVFAPFGSRLIEAAQALGLRAACEGFADRTYQEGGSLTPRSQPGALIEDVDQAVAQVLRMVVEGKVSLQDGRDMSILTDTICVHGDGSHALLLAKSIREQLTTAGIQVRALS
jgi:UPF0271 protein